MSLADFKAQARRLQAFLKAQPTHAASLATAKLASCMEAVAALHGARNWNTLHAGANAAPVPTVASAARTVPPFGHDAAGQVEYLFGRSGSGKSLQTASDLVGALRDGYVATVLDVGRSYHHLALAFGGVSTTPDTFEGAMKLPQARLATFEFEGWQVTNTVLGYDSNPLERRWAKVLPALQARTGPGRVLVVDEFFAWSCIFKDRLPLLLDFLKDASAAGTAIRLIGQAETDFASALEALPPDLRSKLSR